MRWTLLCFSTALVFAQGTTPKPAPTDYDVHGQSGPLDIGAEYMVHSFSSGEQMFLAENYLVVEVALYPFGKQDPITVDLDRFRLRLNHKQTLAPLHAAQVASTLNRSPWATQNPSRVSGGIGVGPLGIPIGGQPRTSPGGPDERRTPTPPRA